MPVRVLHFSDAHIDSASGGKKDPKTGLSVRIIDFLKALDQIVDCAIDEKVDIVLFAGDAYRNPTPVPTYQREWGKRMKRLSNAHIPVLMLIGNHDISPAGGRASALQEYDTLEVPYLHLAKTIRLWKPEDLHDVPVQILTVPWVSKSTMISALGLQRLTSDELYTRLEDEISERIRASMEEIDSGIPAVMLAHYAVPGASYPNRQAVSLGREVMLSAGLVKDNCFSYTALGHIHKYQNLNTGEQPPVIFSGSIERVNFGETDEEKGFVIADIENHHTVYSFRKISGRKFFNRELTIQKAETFQQEVMQVLPESRDVEDAMIRLTINYPREWDTFLDENELRKYMDKALEFHLIRKTTQIQRIRVLGDEGISSLDPPELLKKYCEMNSFETEETEMLMAQAAPFFENEYR
ncbi:MAG: exonuclease SbcCD subunit D [Flexilinea sp.]